MAHTARDIVTRAMRMLGVIIGGTVPTAVQATNGVTALNAMMHAWKGQGVDVNHVDMGLNDQLALAQEHDNGVTALLAVELSGEFLVQPPPSVIAAAANGWAALQATYTRINDEKQDLIAEIGLRRLGANRRSRYPYTI